MKAYSYKGVDKEYKYKIGNVEASNEVEALKLIKENEDVLIIVSLQKLSNFDAGNNLIFKIKEKMLVLENKMKERKKEKFEKLKEKGKVQSPNATLADKSPILKMIKKVSQRGKPETTSEIITLEENARMIFKDSSLIGTEASTEKVVYVEKDLQKDEGKQINWDLLETSDSDPEILKNNKIKVKDKEILLFTRRLQIMISSGVSLLRSLSLLRDSTTKNMGLVLEGVINEINEGNSLSKAISKYPKVFNSNYVSLVSIGETSGELESCLTDIIKMKEQEQKVVKKVKTASIYPSIIAAVLAFLLMGASFFFLPRFEEMYKDQDLGIPLFTEVVFGIASLFPIVAVSFIVIFIIFAFARRKIKKVNQAYIGVRDKMLLKIPVVKNITNALYMYYFSSTVSLMLKNGIRLSDTLALASKSINNIYVRSEIEDIGQLMIHGMSFSEAMRKQEHFDEILIDITHTGEESGQMTFSLSNVADFYQTELNNKVDAAMEIIPSASIITIGLIAAPIIVAAYLPILEISSGAGLNL